MDVYYGHAPRTNIFIASQLQFISYSFFVLSSAVLLLAALLYVFEVTGSETIWIVREWMGMAWDGNGIDEWMYVYVLRSTIFPFTGDYHSISFPLLSPNQL